MKESIVMCVCVLCVCVFLCLCVSVVLFLLAHYLAFQHFAEVYHNFQEVSK